MLSIENLEEMIVRLRNIYNNNEVLDADLRDYYSIIKPGSYFIGKRIVIIFKFPVISPLNYELYRLSIVPNKLQQTFIPPYPFLATNGKTFMYMEAECPKFGRYLLCEETINHQPRGQPDCIQSIIISQSLDESCSPTKISFTKEAMEQLDDRHYTLIFPKPTKVELRCDRQEYVSLHGSYLVTVPHECSLRTDVITIVNTNDEIKGQPMKITEVSHDLDHADSDNIPHLTLNTINLKSLQHLEDRIIIHNPTKLDNADTTVYHTTIPLYTIMASAAVLGLIFFIRHQLRSKRVKVTVPEGKEPEGKENHVYAAPRTSKPQELPATFALKAFK